MKDDNREKKKKLISIFIIAVMVLSTLGVVIFGFTDSGQNSDYGGIGFKQANQKWSAKINGISYQFNLHPTQLDSLNVSSNVMSMLKNAQVVGITYDPESALKQEMALAQYELSSVLQQNGKLVVNGFTKKTSFKVPVITCGNSSVETPILIMEDGNSTHIRSDSSCIILEAGQDGEFIALSERLQYGFLDVIK
jgi:flagellar basal body-associated protein FliL